MMVGIRQKDLNGTIGTELCIVEQRDSRRLQRFSRGPCVIDLKCKVMVSTGTNKHFHRITGRATSIMFFDQMDQRGSRLKPCSAETKRRTWNLSHSQQPHIKAATGFDIPHHESDVIDVLDLNGRR